MQCWHTPQGGAPLQRWVEGLGNQALPGGQKKTKKKVFGRVIQTW